MCHAGPGREQIPRAILSFVPAEALAKAEAEVVHYGCNWSAATPLQRPLAIAPWRVAGRNSALVEDWFTRNRWAEDRTALRVAILP